MLKKTFLIAAVLLPLGACTTSRADDIAYSPEGFSEPDEIATEALTSDYKIAPLDKLRVDVYQVEQLSGEYQVDLMGRIAMPLVGSVDAVNLTVDEFQANLVETLSKDYLVNPDVTVGVLEATGSSITIEGAVRRPGIYPSFGSMTLLQAMAVGGGITDTGNEKRVFVFRQIDGQRMLAGFDLTTIRRGEEPDPEIYRGDIIVVEGSKMKETRQQIFQGVQTFSIFRPF